MKNVYDKEVMLERPLSEGDQIKSAIRELFCTSRDGLVYNENSPLRKRITGVNGAAEKDLCLCKHSERRGALILWYEDI